MQHPGRTTEARTSLTAELDGERIRFSAQKEIVLQCGKASITLTRAGKILIWGTYLLSRSSVSTGSRAGPYRSINSPGVSAS